MRLTSISFSHKRFALLSIISILMIGFLWSVQIRADQQIVCHDLPQDIIEGQSRWTERELITLCQLWIESLPSLPPDPSNHVADEPLAAEFGHHLFFDTRLSQDGTIACATCHIPELSFTDGMAVSTGVGTVDRNAMTIVSTAYSPWLFWDGRSDSLWSQALIPIENPLEHAISRVQAVQVIANDPHYVSLYETIFDDLPDVSDYPPLASPIGNDVAVTAWDSLTTEQQLEINTIFANIGKVIAAYERQIHFGAAPFDGYIESLLEGEISDATLTDEELAGLSIFIGKGQCIDCHNGPLFTNNDFHNTGVQSDPVRGRLQGSLDVLADPFNCLGVYSDAGENDCSELRFMAGGVQTFGAWRTPSLRNIIVTAPYMHAGQLSTLEEVVNHYNTRANDDYNPRLGHLELFPINLSETEATQLVAFLRTLNAPLDAPEEFLVAP